MRWSCPVIGTTGGNSREEISWWGRRMLYHYHRHRLLLLLHAVAEWRYHSIERTCKSPTGRQVGEITSTLRACPKAKYFCPFSRFFLPRNVLSVVRLGSLVQRQKVRFSFCLHKKSARTLPPTAKQGKGHHQESNIVEYLLFYYHLFLSNRYSY